MMNYNELTYGQVLDITGLTSELKIMNNADYPRIIPSRFDLKMNNFYKRRYTLFYCFSMQKGNDLFYYSPTVSLFSTFQQYDESQIRKSMGQGIDSMPEKESLAIDWIVDLIKHPDNTMKNKRLEKILEPIKIDKLKSIGYGYNGEIKGKNGDKYILFGKQFIGTRDNLPDIPDTYEFTSTNPLDLVAKSKGEFERNNFFSHVVLSFIHALENDNLTNNRTVLDDPRGKDINTVGGLFDPFNFSNILNPKNSDLRKTVRKSITPLILGNVDIENNFKNHEPHKRREYTFFRCESDAAMLSQKSIYNPLVLEWFNKYSDDIISQSFSRQFYGGYDAVGFEQMPNINHFFNKNKKRLEHEFNRTTFKTYHGLLDNKKNILYIPVSKEILDSPEKFKNVFTQYTPKKIQEVFIPNNFKVREDFYELEQIITHDVNNNFAHLVNLKGDLKPLQNANFEVVHLKKKWKPKEYIYSPPRMVAALPNGVIISIKPYQMKKYYGQSDKK
ncbi:MAG: hypothetical protein PHN56_02305 [Candidatus Nanoarchaeia archaeon]|nr:hypothetical protein [Candidatus Nanoarchaeia archaeon]